MLGAPLLSMPQSQPHRELVLDEVVLPHTGVWESRWALPALLIDPYNPHTSSVFSGETLHGPSHTSSNPLWPCQLIWKSSKEVGAGLDVHEAFPWGGSPGIPRCALLDGPKGIEFVSMDRKFMPDLKVWDLETGDFLRWIPHPPPLPGKPDLSGFDFIQYAGDVTGDGLGDLFFQDWTLAGDGVVGCLDGQSGQTVWMAYRPFSQNFSRVLPLHSQLQSDIDGDGIRDYVAGFETNKFLQSGHSLTAYSGATGNEIWSIDLDRNFDYRRTIRCNDITGDGIADLVSLMPPIFTSNDNGELIAIDGFDGSTLWIKDCTFIQSLHPSAIWWALDAPISVQPSPDGFGTDVVVRGRIQDSAGSLKATFLHLDAQTGNPLEAIHLSGDLQPWQDDALDVDPISLHSIGDYDGDGFQEFAIQAYLLNDDSNSTTIFPTALAILGQKSLFGPHAPKIGEIHDFHVAIPAHPGAPIQLVFSTDFKQRSSSTMWTPDDWPTSLGNSTLLGKTASLSKLRSTLDGNGQATISIRFPSNPTYAGIPFYARGLIGSPSRPGSIATQTTLLQITLQP
jgi:hypothetical protein